MTAATDTVSGPAARGIGDGSARAHRWMAALGGLCGVLIVAATAEIVIDGAQAHSPLIPKSPQIAGWLSGIGERLGFRVFLIALLVFTASYADPAGARARPRVSA